MVLVNGYILTKQLMRGNGLVQKNMAKVLKLGLTDIFTEANLRIALGVGLEF